MPDRVKEKLVELLRSVPAESGIFYADWWALLEGAEDIADVLIAGGVTVLPLKIGDVVYFPVKDYHDSAIIDGMYMNARGTIFTWAQYEVGVDTTECWDYGEFGIEEIGKTVFLTRAEAQAHLPTPPGGE